MPSGKRLLGHMVGRWNMQSLTTSSTLLSIMKECKTASLEGGWPEKHGCCQQLKPNRLTVQALQHS